MKRGGLAILLLMLAPAQFANAVTFDVTQPTRQVGPFNGTQGGALAFTLIGLAQISAASETSFASKPGACFRRRTQFLPAHC